MVEIKNLRKQFGTLTAVDDVSFSVQRGEVLGFLGPNGAGKSTTMKMVTGFLTPTAGTIRVVGEDIQSKPLLVKQKIGYLPEGAPAYPDMTPLEFLDFIADIRGLTGEYKSRRIKEVIARVNLESVLNQAIDTLSKGYKRRVGLAQAILHDPEVLILDEPTDGLDPNQKHEVRSLIKEMAAEKVIILSTHILEEVHAVCSRAVIIAKGKVLADGVPSDLEAKSPNYNAINLTIQSNSESESIRSALAQLPQVAQVTLLPSAANTLSYHILPKDKASIVTTISQYTHSQQWQVEELHVDKGQLDEVFRAITSTR